MRRSIGETTKTSLRRRADSAGLACECVPALGVRDSGRFGQGLGAPTLASSLVSILFTDLVGSTELASEVGDTAADDLRRRHFADLREAIAATGGTEVKTIGDALMVSYSGAADAVAGAVAMQRAVERRNRSLEGHRLEIRVGVSVGDANFEEGDWFGAPVVEASRLCSSANGGQILVSELVRALAGSRAEFELRPLGTRELKGLPAPVAVCDVEWRVAQHVAGAPVPCLCRYCAVVPVCRAARRVRNAARRLEGVVGRCAARRACVG